MRFPKQGHVIAGIALGLAIALPMTGCIGQLPNSADELNQKVVDRPPLSNEKLTELMGAYQVPENLHADVSVYASLDAEGNTFGITQSADIAGITTHRMVNSRFPSEETLAEYYTEAQKEGTRTWGRSITNIIAEDGNVTPKDDDKWTVRDEGDESSHWRETLQKVQAMTIDKSAVIENDGTGSVVTLEGDAAKALINEIRPMLGQGESIDAALNGDYQMVTATILVNEEGRVTGLSVMMVPTDSKRVQTQMSIVTSDIPEEELQHVATPDTVKTEAEAADDAS
jgi:hypothetical protein